MPPPSPAPAPPAALPAWIPLAEATAAGAVDGGGDGGGEGYGPSSGPLRQVLRATDTSAMSLRRLPSPLSPQQQQTPPPLLSPSPSTPSSSTSRPSSVAAIFDVSLNASSAVTAEDPVTTSLTLSSITISAASSRPTIILGPGSTGLPVSALVGVPPPKDDDDTPDTAAALECSGVSAVLFVGIGPLPERVPIGVKGGSFDPESPRAATLVHRRPIYKTVGPALDIDFPVSMSPGYMTPVNFCIDLPADVPPTIADPTVTNKNRDVTYVLYVVLRRGGAPPVIARKEFILRRGVEDSDRPPVTREHLLFKSEVTSDSAEMSVGSDGRREVRARFAVSTSAATPAGDHRTAARVGAHTRQQDAAVFVAHELRMQTEFVGVRASWTGGVGGGNGGGRQGVALVERVCSAPVRLACCCLVSTTSPPPSPNLLRKAAEATVAAAAPPPLPPSTPPAKGTLTTVQPSAGPPSPPPPVAPSSSDTLAPVDFADCGSTGDGGSGPDIVAPVSSSSGRNSCSIPNTNDGANNAAETYDIDDVLDSLIGDDSADDPLTRSSSLSSIHVDFSDLASFKIAPAGRLFTKLPSERADESALADQDFWAIFQRPPSIRQRPSVRRSSPPPSAPEAPQPPAMDHQGPIADLGRGRALVQQTRADTNVYPADDPPDYTLEESPRPPRPVQSYPFPPPRSSSADRAE
ncbi:hypothetical protein HK405_002171, partial [Cladochytrium tenue]